MVSPDKFIYVLDGGHRISVLLAWIRDDWGEQAASGLGDINLQRNSLQSAQQVRTLLRSKNIGTFEEWRRAGAEYKKLLSEEKEPEFLMSSSDLKHAKQYSGWKSSKTGFPILWVRGDYETAERSFLKINRTGRRLSEWETKLVENRSSSFARAIMSVANINSASYCWPRQDRENPQNSALLLTKVEAILTRVKELHELLFIPSYSTPIVDPKQPLLAIPEARPELRPAYTAELFTIIEGKKGKKAETESLLAADKGGTASVIVNNGLSLLEDATDVINNIYGASPRSMTLVPLVYFYSVQGTYVRSLLYGMLYWLTQGSDSTSVFYRKLLFSVHRAAFEKVLIANKEKIIRRIARRIGSGPEVTYPTAKYFDGLLFLIIKHGGRVDQPPFGKEHDDLIETLGKGADDKGDATTKVSSNRVFQDGPRNVVRTKNYLGMFQNCDICGGRYFPGLYTQIDHIVPHAAGGLTSANNGRETHPFCNNNRPRIEALKSGKEVLSLPKFDDPTHLPKPEQLTLLSLFEEASDDDLDSELNDEDAID